MSLRLRGSITERELMWLLASIKLRPNVGPRGMEDIVNIKMKMERDSKTGF